jgi:hypothetical protein
LEGLLFESEELQPKESIKNLKKHLVGIENVIEGRAETMINPRTNTPTVIPGLVTEEEQTIVDEDFQGYICMVRDNQATR